MTRHLLALRIGPVQDFIAQARRTRDLWFGSALLSDASRAVARALTAQEGTAEGLVFPAPRELDEGAGFANKIVALVHGEPRRLAANAREAARRFLVDKGLESFHQHEDLVEPSSRPVALEQLETFLEFHAAWAPCATDAHYAQALEEVESELAARKQLHAFAPWTHHRAGAHKSSLDGARESVLRSGPHSGGSWRRYRIGTREELDAIGLLKRTAPHPEQFVPIPTIGMADWLQRAAEQQPALLQALRGACERYPFTRVARHTPWVRAFPFDAQVLLPDRWRPYFEDCGVDDAREADHFGNAFVRPLLKALGEPFPYVACLVADGDHMGRTLQLLARRGPSAHRALSEALSVFSREARQLVEEREHRGVLVYAGGDDVLAFVSPADVTRYALALREAFDRVVRAALAESEVEVPTLSVGIGIGHVLESLGDLVELGRQAERAAKDAGRNALAVSVARHSGRRLTWSASWRDGPVALIEEDIARLARNEPPMKKVHEVALMLRRAPRDVSPEERTDWKRLIAREARRILARAELGRGAAPLRPEQAGLELPPPGDRARMRQHLEAWTARLEIASILASARPAARPAPGGAA